MSRFATVAHLRSWAGLCPQLNESAGKIMSRRLRHGAPWLKTVLVQCAWAATRNKHNYLHAQFVRLRARRGPQKAIIAVAASILSIAYYLLRNQVPYRDRTLYFTRVDQEANRAAPGASNQISGLRSPNSQSSLTALLLNRNAIYKSSGNGLAFEGKDLIIMSRRYSGCLHFLEAPTRQGRFWSQEAHQGRARRAHRSAAALCKRYLPVLRSSTSKRAVSDYVEVQAR